MFQWWRLSNNAVGTPSTGDTVKVTARTVQKLKSWFGFDTEGGSVHLKRCGLILHNDFRNCSTTLVKS